MSGAAWAEEQESRRLWAAMVLSRSVETCESILVGRRVLARNLDVFVLRHALRGATLPPAGSYLTVDVGHLDAIVEATSAINAAARARDARRRR